MSRMWHFGAGRSSCNRGFCDRFPVMRNWKKLGWIGLVVFGLALALIFAAFLRAGRSTAGASSWNSHAIEGTLAGVRAREVDAGHAAVVFSYDLDNKTNTDYRLASGPNLVIMSRLTAEWKLDRRPTSHPGFCRLRARQQSNPHFD